LGIATVPITLANPVYEQFFGTIHQDEYIWTGPLFNEYWDYWMVFIAADEEVLVTVEVADPTPWPPWGPDIDLWMFSPFWDYDFLGLHPYGFFGDPSIAEQVTFKAPEDGWYHIFIQGWWIPPEGSDYTVTVESTSISYTAEPVGVSRGALVSFAHNAWNGKMHASMNAAMWGCWFNYPEVCINEATVSGHPYYLPPSATFCSEDHLAVGGRYMAAEIDEVTTPEEAKFEIENIHWIHYLRLEGSEDWLALADLTNAAEGPVKPDHDQGVLFRYSKLLEVGFFRPGELAEKLGGTGLVAYKSEWWWTGGPEPELENTFIGYFWLLPPP
jgi:hypothetical protein